MKKKKRLLWQLYPSYLLITLISVVAVTIYATSALKEFNLDQISGDLKSRAHLLEKQIHQFLGPMDADVIDALCKEIGKTSATRITVILSEGKVIGDSNKDPAVMDNHALRPEIIEARKGDVGKSIRFSSTLQQNMMYVAIPLKKQNKVIAVIRTSLPITAVEKELKSIQSRIALGGLLIALLATGISLYVSRRISLPIEKVKEGAEHFARGDLSHRLPGTDLVEIDGLVDAMNQMATLLDERIKTIISQRNELEAVLSSMAEGVVAFDVDEYIISINQAAAQIFECEPVDLLNHTVQEALRNPEFQRFVRNALFSSENLESDITLYQDSERIIHAHSTSLFDSGGTSTGILVVLSDVTQLRRLENMRRDFAANVSHEIKTPLTAIKGFVETLLHNTMDSPEESRRFLDIIARHVDRLTSIVDDLMKLSRIEQQDEKQEIKRETEPIKKIIQRAIQTCLEKTEAKKIDVDLACKEDVSARIDATLIEQAIFNLLDNAINYSQEQSVVKISAFKQDKEVIISVKDNGTGISEEHLPRLFERFYRADKARSRSLGGTGLGLAIVKHIAQAHGGRVSVDSTPGKGSIFSLHLPIK